MPPPGGIVRHPDAENGMTAAPTESDTLIATLLTQTTEARKRKAYPLAIQTARRLLAWAPASAEAWTNLADALDGSGRLSAARMALARLILIDPCNAGARRNAIAILLKHRRRTDAWHASRALVILEPADPRGWEFLARCHAMLGRADEAKKFLGPLACIRPNDPAVAIAWARSLMEARDLNGAEFWCRKAISLAGETPERLFDLARVLWARGDRVEGARLLDDLVARNPRFALRARALRLTVGDADFMRSTGA